MKQTRCKGQLNVMITPYKQTHKADFQPDLLHSSLSPSASQMTITMRGWRRTESQQPLTLPWRPHKSPSFDFCRDHLCITSHQPSMGKKKLSLKRRSIHKLTLIDHSGSKRFCDDFNSSQKTREAGRGAGARTACCRDRQRRSGVNRSTIGRRQGRLGR